MRTLTAILLLVLVPAVTNAGEADVVDVRVTATGGDVYRFEVTVRHADEGWDHYADRWDVVGPDGAVLGTRVLHHPHVTEQPFTRGLVGVRWPEAIGAVTVRAHDSVHGYGGRVEHFELPGAIAPGSSK